MTEEDEAFNEIERRAKQRKEAVRAAMRSVEEDDDIQIYQRPWVGLTDDEYFALQMKIKAPMISVQDYIDAMRMVEAKLKELNK